MAFLFWLFWVLDLIGFVLVLAGADWRAANGAHNIFTSFSFWAIILLLLALIGGPLLRFVFKQALAALGLVALPWLGLLVAYLVDRKGQQV